MNKRLYLLGAGGLGRQVSEQVRAGYDCFFLDDVFRSEKEICGIPLIGTISDFLFEDPDKACAVVTIGDNRVRESLTKKLINAGYDIPSIVFPGAYISPFATVGRGCLIMNNALVQNGSSVGDGVILNPGVEVHHDAVVEDYSLIYTNTCVRTKAHIGKRAWIDSTLTIPNEVHIADDGIVRGKFELDKRL